MKKRSLLLALIFGCGFFISSAQTLTFNKGDKVINLGVGFGGNYYSGSGITRTPLLAGSLDVGILDNILEKGSVGVGGYVAYKGYKWESGSVYGWKSTNLVIGPRGTFHYPLVDKLDTYIGVLLAYHVVSEKQTGNWGANVYNGSSSNVYFSGFLGARYYVSDKFAIMLELGSGNLGAGTLGIALKLK